MSPTILTREAGLLPRLVRVVGIAIVALVLLVGFADSDHGAGFAEEYSASMHAPALSVPASQAPSVEPANDGVLLACTFLLVCCVAVLALVRAGRPHVAAFGTKYIRPPTPLTVVAFPVPQPDLNALSISRI